MKIQKTLQLSFKSIMVYVLLLSFSSNLNAQQLDSKITNNVQSISFYIKTNNYKISASLANASKFIAADFYQTPLEITQEKNSTIKKGLKKPRIGQEA